MRCPSTVVARAVTFSVAIVAVVVDHAAARADPLLLEQASARQGTYLSVGALFSAQGADDAEVGGLGTFGGSDFQLRIGQMLTPWLGVGLSLGGGFGRSGSWSTAGGHLAVEAQLAPLGGLDLAARLGIGMEVRALSRRDPAAETDDDPAGMFGARYHVGLSYDWFPLYSEGKSGGFAVTFVALATMATAEGVIAGGGLFGIEGTWWTGLSTNKLISQAR